MVTCAAMTAILQSLDHSPRVFFRLALKSEGTGSMRVQISLVSIVLYTTNLNNKQYTLLIGLSGACTCKVPRPYYQCKPEVKEREEWSIDWAMTALDLHPISAGSNIRNSIIPTATKILSLYLQFYNFNQTRHKIYLQTTVVEPLVSDHLKCQA